MRKTLVMMVMAAGLTMAVPAQAETWSCDYDGSWSTFGNSDRGRFKWRMVWQSKTNGGWRVTGAYSDSYGQSVLEGNCNDRACMLKQVYQSGKLAGNEYFWKGRYSDESSGDAKTINRFEGTWGNSPSASDGEWKAIAVCTRN